ncbi:MAG: hypothetical protein HXS48_17070 [Theionarchaea archaeon]|nr:hypothetical protein [Theionarchaea archaeon]
MRGINKVIKLQFLWVTVFFLGVIIDVIYQIIGENDLSSVLPSLMQYFTRICIPVSLIILLVHCSLLVITPFHLFVYYHVWIKHIFATLKKCAQSPHSFKYIGSWVLSTFFNEYFDTLILNSFCEQEVSGKDIPENQPVFIRRTHLTEKDYWPHWTFAIMLLFNKVTIRRSHAAYEVRFCLEVDLRNQSYGIYNTEGKKFLNNTFLNNEFRRQCIEEAERIENFLKSGPPHKLVIDAKKMPLRWASGGVLPIVYLEGRYWYVLYFRDAEPIGLNMANGASDAPEEFKDLRSLIYREFSEELVLLSREPHVGDVLPVTHRVVQFPDPLPQYIYPKIMKKEFAKPHRQLRREHDDMTIELGDGPIIKPVRTPFEVEITYYDANLRDTSSMTIENVIFNINPTEFGIEVLSVSYFNMKEEEYLMDGEISGRGPALIRRPVMLVSCDYLQEVYNEMGSLGTDMEERPHMNCKDLGEIPFGEYKIYDRDIEFRKRRLTLLQRTAETKNSAEAKRYQGWLNKYEPLFTAIRELSCDITSKDHSPLTVLLPATWKTIETICYYNLLDNLPKPK